LEISKPISPTPLKVLVETIPKLPAKPFKVSPTFSVIKPIPLDKPPITAEKETERSLTMLPLVLIKDFNNLYKYFF